MTSSVDRSDVVARKRAELVRSFRRSDVPAVVTFLHHLDDISLTQFQLVDVPRRVRIQGAVPAARDIMNGCSERVSS